MSNGPNTVDTDSMNNTNNESSSIKRLKQLREDALLTLSGEDLEKALHDIDQIITADTQTNNKQSVIYKSAANLAINYELANHARNRPANGLLDLLHHFYTRIFGNDAAKGKMYARIIQESREDDALRAEIQQQCLIPSYEENMRRAFRKKRWLFHAYCMILVMSAIVAVIFSVSLNLDKNLSLWGIITGASILYVAGGRRLYRCPACNHQIDYHARLGDPRTRKCQRCNIHF